MATETISWATPMPPYKIAPLYQHSLTPTVADLTDSNLRMTSIKCNDPDITGYSACWDGRLIALYAHCKGDETPLYKEVDACYENAIWIYLPLGNDEWISDIWQRVGRFYRCTAILVRDS